MTTAPILHVFGWSKLIVVPYIAFVRDNFNADDHEFLICGKVSEADREGLGNIIYCESPLKNIALLSRHLRGARKIIIHGLFDMHFCYALALHPWLLNKSYWVIWGGDLYVHMVHRENGWRRVKNELVRRFLISRFGNLITCIKGDAELARKWYGAKGRVWECFSYTSNIFVSLSDATHKDDNALNILVGNSANPSNNHQEIIDRLAPYCHRNIFVCAVLSYGGPEHADSVRKYGKEKIGNKFTSLDSLMPLKVYLEFLSKIDVAIFNHNRQQAMGNTIFLLGNGKKVFIRKDTTQWAFFVGLGVTVFDSETFDLDMALNTDTSHNNAIISSYFNVDNLRVQYRAIFA